MTTETNTTVLTLTVTDGVTSYNPTLSVADNGTWSINDDGLRARMDAHSWQEWLVDLWAMPEVRGLRR